MDDNPKVRIISESADTIVFGMTMVGGSVVFTFIQTFEKINIEWRIKNAFGIDKKLKWSFHDNANQVEMARIILQDTENFFKNLSL